MDLSALSPSEKQILIFSFYRDAELRGARLLFNLFGLDPQLGLYTSIVSRVRDFVWIAAGLLLIWATPGAPAASAASAAPSL